MRDAVTIKFSSLDISNSHSALLVCTVVRTGLISDTLTYSLSSVSLFLFVLFHISSPVLNPSLPGFGSFVPLHYFSCVLILLIIHDTHHIPIKIPPFICNGWIIITFELISFCLPSHTFFTIIKTHKKTELGLLHTSYPPSLSPTSFLVSLTPWQPLLPHPPVRVFCCRITLCLLRFVLCSHPITTTGEVTGSGLHVNYVAVNVWKEYSSDTMDKVEAIQGVFQVQHRIQLVDGLWIQHNISRENVVLHHHNAWSNNEINPGWKAFDDCLFGKDAICCNLWTGSECKCVTNLSVQCMTVSVSCINRKISMKTVYIVLLFLNTNQKILPSTANPLQTFLPLSSRSYLKKKFDVLKSNEFKKSIQNPHVHQDKDVPKFCSKTIFIHSLIISQKK